MNIAFYKCYKKILVFTYNHISILIILEKLTVAPANPLSIVRSTIPPNDEAYTNK